LSLGSVIGPLAGLADPGARCRRLERGKWNAAMKTWAEKKGMVRIVVAAAAVVDV
jgi:hypothetical protein